MFDLTVANLVVWTFIGLTLYTMRRRWVGDFESNWALVYYLVLVLFIRTLEGEFNNFIVFAAIVSALFLRFEFLGGWFLRFFRLTEFVCLCYVLLECLSLLGRH